MSRNTKNKKKDLYFCRTAGKYLIYGHHKGASLMPAANSNRRVQLPCEFLSNGLEVEINVIN